MHSNLMSKVMQRSQSTPNVGVWPTEQHSQAQAPRRTKTSIDLLALSRRDTTRVERNVDPFSLAGFFPSSPRQSDQEQLGWWRDESLEEGPEEFVDKIVDTVDGDISSLGCNASSLVEKTSQQRQSSNVKTSLES
ncbi:hypothetical protein B0F90DRAFT_85071 [Multifurca ochricompacta]|uniref:Uncharacterized protein n=1 Tax=Multifurca ochricompacta TaxID=376703 RepID=A0AAD4MG38_9AGAM|nr:hypothetical protein B0F90DRAFT_85071 [Multifurca ochricompacta]